MNDYLAVFLLAFFGSIMGLLGGVLFMYKRGLSKTLERYSIPFAAGVLLTVSFLALLPEAVDYSGKIAFGAVSASFLGAYLFEYIIFEIHHHNSYHHARNYSSSAALVIIGDTIHNFIDGVAIAAAYSISPGLGLIIAFSTFLHEIPHEVGDFGILLKAGWKKGDILLVNIASAFATIIGAFLVFVFSINKQLMGILLAISAGLFLYLGASDFLPNIKAEEKNKIKAVIPLLIGILAMLLVLFAIPHSKS